MSEYYKNGFDQNISKTHEWRTADNCCKYMLKYLRKNYHVLDIGCGPGSITCDIAKLIPKGNIIGIDPVKELVDAGNQLAILKNIPNVRFESASAYNLPFDDNSFDLVHSHQVLVHLADPVRALKEMFRVVKPAGFVCVRDSDLDSTVVYPDRYAAIKQYFLLATKISGLSTKARHGRQLKDLAMQAGFKPEYIACSVDNWCIAGNSDRAWFADMFINRIENSQPKLVEGDEELNRQQRENVVNAWGEWAGDETGWLTFMHCEIVCEKHTR